jgi:hypothetical protein
MRFGLGVYVQAVVEDDYTREDTDLLHLVATSCCGTYGRWCDCPGKSGTSGGAFKYAQLLLVLQEMSSKGRIAIRLHFL